MRKAYFFLALILLLPMMSAVWSIPKYTTCNFMNVTQADCDRLWCGIHDCSYNETMQLCHCPIIDGNQTNATNMSAFEEMLKSFNVTIVDVQNKIMNLSNSTTNSSVNETELFERLKEYTDNQTKTLRIFVQDELAGADYEPVKSSGGDNTIVYVIIGVVVIVGAMVVMGKKKEAGRRPSTGDYPNYEHFMELQRQKNKLEKEGEGLP